MTTLITGGTSRIGLALAKRLQAAGKNFVVAGRSPDKIPSDYRHVLLDWNDPSTFGNPFTENHSIENVYLLPPPGFVEPLPVLKPFVDLAIENGVKYFVLISASVSEKGGLRGGRVHQYLEDVGIGYFVLRPTWFTENVFSAHAFDIRKHGQIITSAPKGRIPFVSAEDIAQLAFDVIVNHPEEMERAIVGPELFTYDEHAAVLGKYFGKPITHKTIPAGARIAVLTSHGLPEDFATWLIGAEVGAGEGSEERRAGEPGVYIGKLRTVDVFAAGRDFWNA